MSKVGPAGSGSRNPYVTNKSRQTAWAVQTTENAFVGRLLVERWRNSTRAHLFGRFVLLLATVRPCNAAEPPLHERLLQHLRLSLDRLENLARIVMTTWQIAVIVENAYRVTADSSLREAGIE